jgi:hypothetical protein
MLQHVGQNNHGFCVLMVIDALSRHIDVTKHVETLKRRLFH